MIGGNTFLELQLNFPAKNGIGEAVDEWRTVQKLKGWLDYQSGDSPRTSYNSKIQESTHFFIGDYVPIDKRIEAENCIAVCDGKVYDVLIIDNPMGKNRQIEIYLKLTGGQQ
jgi:hypothetical protein